MFFVVGLLDVFCNLFGVEGKVNLIVGEYICILCIVRRRKYGWVIRLLINFDFIFI